MKYSALVLLFLFHFNLFSQELVRPVEKKIELSRTDTNYESYVFKDIHNVFEKFIGSWVFIDEVFEIDLEVHRYFDTHNRQDGLLIDLRLIKNSDTIIKNLPHLIEGGVFEEEGNVNRTVVFFSEISDSWQCGQMCPVNLTIEEDTLIWEIDQRQLRYNQTARLFPKIIKFKRQ